ncbi:MAG: hypothetical protein KDJ19_08700 [Hyphomicrobiaceae bacterium]|nr:hypothetical protein [Hyphomicrobiaceae bacterium]MCC0022723.1 hypothetical protein [Hyphomicrobiaceae bacterium]
MATLAIVSLAACSTLDLGTAVRLQQVDFVNDDIASMAIAIDVPVVLVPLPDRSHFVLTAHYNDGTEGKVVANLARAITADINEQLPPPARDRGYYIFELTSASQTEIRALQDDIRAKSSANGGPGGRLASGFEAEFCRTGNLDPRQTTFSVYITLPGSTDLSPIVSNETLTTLLAQTGEQDVPSCADVLN